MKIKGDGFLSNNGQEEANKIFARNVRVFHSLELSIASFREFAFSLELSTCRKQGLSATQAMRLVFEKKLPEFAL